MKRLVSFLHCFAIFQMTMAASPLVQVRHTLMVKKDFLQVKELMSKYEKKH